MSGPGIRHRRPGPPPGGKVVPRWALVASLVVAGLVGLLLSRALEVSSERPTQSSAVSAAQPDDAPGKNASGLPVVTEGTLGPEVQRLIESGTLQSPANFDVTVCLHEQHITDPVLMMEEVAWGPEGVDGWLIVHGPTTQDTLRKQGGTVNATVVRPTCGTPDSGGLSDSRVWSGSTMLGNS
jgi:hypothetical protein